MLKDKTTSPTGELSRDAPEEVSSSSVALQQSELKKEKILSLLVSKKKLSFKPLTCILDEHSAPVVTRYLASSRALTRSFDLYLQKVMSAWCYHCCWSSGPTLYLPIFGVGEGKSVVSLAAWHHSVSSLPHRRSV